MTFDREENWTMLLWIGRRIESRNIIFYVVQKNNRRARIIDILSLFLYSICFSLLLQVFMFCFECYSSTLGVWSCSFKELLIWFINFGLVFSRAIFWQRSLPNPALEGPAPRNKLRPKILVWAHPTRIENQLLMDGVRHYSRLNLGLERTPKTVPDYYNYEQTTPMLIQTITQQGTRKLLPTVI